MKAFNLGFIVVTVSTAISLLVIDDSFSVFFVHTSEIQTISRRQSSISSFHVHDDSNLNLTPGATPSTTPNNTSTNLVGVGEEPVYYYYSDARVDRSGMSFSFMLLAHAYAFSKNSNNNEAGGGGVHYYAGACPRTSANHPAVLRHPERRQEQQQLIQDLGLQNILKFACPANTTASEEKKHNVVWLDGEGTYAEKQYDTPEWRAYLRSQVDWEKVKTGEEHEDGMFRIAVHVRRGDVSPCNMWEARYLSNAHYLRVLDHFTPKDRPTRVYIFSQKRSFESWAPFQARNYTMMLGTSINTTWAYMMKADILVLGYSSFGFFPAAFNNKQVIYMAESESFNDEQAIHKVFDLAPVQGWTVLNDTYVDLALQDKQRLVPACEREMTTVEKAKVLHARRKKETQRLDG